ncbi:STAS domain-containing protein [Pseudonocardia sp. RS010]|uniref:STAS domain-containing protein n=1 Tax=Pseudonocardia sp. RS010 TaxID=3385979 RepID=UPI0039A33AFA
MDERDATVVALPSTRGFPAGTPLEMRAVYPVPWLAVLQLTGEIDMSTCGAMGRWVESHPAERVVVDLTEVDLLAACGARRLAEVRETLRNRGSELCVVVSGDPLQEQILRVVGSFDLYGSVVSACRGGEDFRPPGPSTLPPGRGGGGAGRGRVSG